jgi:gamma-glutamyl-gamma-aminobutyrate hydrolase PuuD
LDVFQATVVRDKLSSKMSTNRTNVFINRPEPKQEAILNDPRFQYMEKYGATVEDYDLGASIIESSEDPMFALLKQPLNLNKVFNDPAQIHIALSDDGSLYFRAIWAAARLIMQKHPNVLIHLLTLNIATAWGDQLLTKFDGFINPGGMDSFPIDLQEFNNADCPHTLELEKTYQFIAKKTYELNIPYFGICSGSQHLALVHESFLQPVQGYQKTQHDVIYLPGTLSHFQLLNSAQQKEALMNCELSDITFKVDVFNSYAAIANKLGADLQLGALSFDGAAMAYAHHNGIRYGTQYHPEHSYVKKESHAHFPNILFDNFIEIARTHHAHRTHNETHPTEHFASVKTRLIECIKTPTCLVSENDFCELNGNH